MSKDRFESDPLDILRDADPIDPLEVPTDTTGAHARALFQEVTSMDTMEREAPTKRPTRNRMVLAVSGATAAVLLVASIALLGGNGAQPEIIAGGDPVGGAGMCVETYDLNTLINRDFAFDGTVTSASGDQVTFDVGVWYAGGDDQSATFLAQGFAPGSVSSLGSGLEIGERYLVSGSQGNVWACGFTMTYDTAIAEQWAAAFGG